MDQQSKIFLATTLMNLFVLMCIFVVCYVRASGVDPLDRLLRTTLTFTVSMIVTIVFQYFFVV